MKGIGIPLEGVQFLVDEHGNCTSVALDLHIWGDLWEDFYDGMLAEATRDEPTIPWEQVKAEMDAVPAAEPAAVNGAQMKGVQFLMDEQGNKKAVVLANEDWGGVWANLYEDMLFQAALRKDIPAVPSEQAKSDVAAEEAAFERELAKIDDEYRQYMQEIAEEGIEADLREWPEY